MTTPHRHAALIKLWADGAIVQRKMPNGTWRDVYGNAPYWETAADYRVKTTHLRFRNFLYKPAVGAPQVAVATEFTKPEHPLSVENLAGFAGWINDWAEVPL